MESTFIAETVGAVENIATLQDLDNMAVGDFIAVGDGRVVIGIDSTPASISDVKEVMFITKTADRKFRNSVSIPREAIRSLNYQAYSAPVAKVITIGGTTALLALNIPATGEANITVKNLSYNHNIATQRLNVSITKRGTESVLAFVNRLVAKLNVSNTAVPFFTAAKVEATVGADTFYGITITAANDSVDLDIHMDGILEFAPKRVTTQPKNGLGKGADVLRMEQESSKNLGNHGYIENTDLWFNMPMEAVASANYNGFSLAWAGIAIRSISKATVVANNTMSIFVPTTSDATPFNVLFALIIGNTYEPVGGFETGTQTDSNAIDETKS
jgi:hypothetical protein